MTATRASRPGRNPPTLRVMITFCSPERPYMQRLGLGHVEAAPAMRSPSAVTSPVHAASAPPTLMKYAPGFVREECALKIPLSAWSGVVLTMKSRRQPLVQLSVVHCPNSGLTAARARSGPAHSERCRVALLCTDAAQAHDHTFLPSIVTIRTERASLQSTARLRSGMQNAYRVQTRASSRSRARPSPAPRHAACS